MRIKIILGIRDRVFYVFNRIDQTWYNAQLRQRLDDLIETQFRVNQRIYKTSGLLGFYGSQIKSTSKSDRFGLDSIDLHPICSDLKHYYLNPLFSQRRRSLKLLLIKNCS